MALQPKLSISNQSDCRQITLVDITGDYNANSNTTGYGAPNPDRTDITAATITITRPYTETALSPIDTFASPFLFPQTNLSFSVSNEIVGGSVAGTSITSATNAAPIVITTLSAHGLATGDEVTIFGVLGNTAANGTFIITILSTTTFSLNGSVGNGTYASGGTVIANDSLSGKLEDGVWKFDQVITALGVNYTVTAYFLMTCQVECCISKRSVQINQRNSSNAQYRQFLEFTADLDSVNDAFDAGDYDTAESILEQLKNKIDCDGC